VLAHLLEENLKCPQCGTRREEWNEDRQAYVADVWRCYGCETIEWEQKGWSDDGDASVAGLKFGLVPRDQASRLDVK